MHCLYTDTRARTCHGLGINDIRIDGIFVILFLFGFEYEYEFSFSLSLRGPRVFIVVTCFIVWMDVREQCLGTFIYHKVVTLKKSEYKKLCVFDLIRLD